MRVVAIIPAYNEEKTISDVLDAVKKVDAIERTIVVSDGSTDATADVAASMGVDVIRLENNIGKGGAMKAGIDSCTADIIVFLDADLIGLKKKHIEDLLKPVMDNAADMSIGIFSNGRLVTDLAQKITPCLSGQRAIRKYLLDIIPNMDITRYGVELALTRCVQKENIEIAAVELRDMTHYTKEQKLGLVKGFGARLRMYWDIMKCIKASKAER